MNSERLWSAGVNVVFYDLDVNFMCYVKHCLLLSTAAKKRSNSKSISEAI